MPHCIIEYSNGLDDSNLIDSVHKGALNSQLFAENDIKSTEEFIELSATKSTMSGNYYTVKCVGKETITTQYWLLEELKRYRNK